jgi:hypothetical protein
MFSHFYTHARVHFIVMNEEKATTEKSTCILCVDDAVGK